MAKAGQLATATDATALEIFQNQWDVYRKFLKYDYLSNAEAAATLRAFLAGEVARPYRFLDLACGDASGIVAALWRRRRSSSIAASTCRLRRWRWRRTTLPRCPARSCSTRPISVPPCAACARPEDIVWISLSLHHLDTDAKLVFMREVRQGLEPGGAFLVYEPTRRDGEDRPAYLDRFEDIGRREWTELTPTEFAEALKHVRTCDLPETVSEWERLGREAGFASSRELYKSPTDLFRLFLYRP